MHATTKPNTHTTTTTTLVLDEVLDAAACKAMRRFERRARRSPDSDAAIDLRRTRAVRSNAWAVLVKACTDLSRSGYRVTVLAGTSLQRLLQVSDLVRYARVVISPI